MCIRDRNNIVVKMLQKVQGVIDVYICVLMTGYERGTVSINFIIQVI